MPTPPPPPIPSCVHELVEAQVRRTPGAVALSFAGGSWTYAALDRGANRVAHLLRGLRVGPEVRVGVFMERGPELVAALLGVLKAGGAYVPLDPAYPPARVEALVAAARPAVVLTGSALAGRLPSSSPAAVELDGGALEGMPEEGFPSGAGPENLSHVIHTSGSTGAPKGVMVRHGAVAALIAWAPEHLGIREGTAVLASTSVCFDVHVAETWIPLALGARVVMVPNALHLAELGEEVEVASMVPSSAAELLRIGGIPPCVRSLNLGGEPLRRELAEALYARPGVERVLDLWGPTEDTTYSTCARVARGEGGPVPVGFPVAGTRVHVAGPDLRPVGPGETGEVFVAGAGLGRGYLDRPAATAERWLPDPFSGEPGARMYRVGDLGRWRPDGALECLGRLDHQVKVRGYRVELGEVEEALRAHPAVADAVAAVREETPGDRVLVAFVEPVAGAAVAAGELRALAGARLPEYMVPAAVGVLEALPRLPNGKVDRHALPPLPRDPAAGEGYRAPRTPAEAAVCGIWEQVLGVGRVGIDDDFFELGGHSLRATQVVARVREALGARISPFALFELRTPASLARAAERAGAVEDEVRPLGPEDRSRPVPLSFSQQAIWFFQDLSPGMRSYDFQAALHFVGRLDPGALARALGEIVRRHEIFRTAFRVVDGAPGQIVRPPFPVHLPVRDLRGSPEALEAAVRETAREPFRLDRLPLVRWTLFRTDEERWTLAVVEHHFVHDGWSFGVFLQELTAIYAAFVEGRPSPLAEPEVQFADYALWQRRWAGGAEAARQLAYWKRRLTPRVPVLELPADRPRPATMSFRGRSRRHLLDPRLAARAREASRRGGATLYTTLLTAFQALLHRYTGQTDFAVGGGVANRNDRVSEQLIGMIVNTVAIRAELEGDPTGAELQARVHRVVSEAYAHREIPFGEVVEAVQPERALSRLPVYQVAFSFHDAPYPSFVLPGARMEVEEALGNGSAKFDLQVVVIPRGSQRAGGGDEVTMIWEHATDLFDDRTVERMEAHYRALLRGLLESPEARVSELPLLTGEERAALVAASAGARGAFDPAPVHRQFARHATERPEALAVEGGGVSMTYGELAAAAARIAGALRSRGAGPERVVAVCAGRSPALVAGLLGTLAAGAAYLPVDPAYPDERIRRMLLASGAVALLAGEEAAARVAAFGVPVVPLGARGEVPGGAAPAGWEGEALPETLAYLIHTSGSTGEPKGVMVEHRSLANLVGWHRAELGVGPQDRAALGASVGFDASGWEIWPYLAAGASLHVVPDALRTEPDALAGWLAGRGITLAFLPTAVAEAVLPLRWPAGTALRALLTGGDRLLARPPADLPFALVNAYGPTETTVVATAGPVRPGGGVPSVGRPVANTAAHVLDGRGTPLPPGVPGELCLGGVQVARGYRGDPALTAERFVPDPFSSDPGGRLYRTGDRARRLADGRIAFVGRADQQVKVRGFRVETGEVEAALRTHPAVSAAAAAPRPDEGGAARLVAWVVAAGADGDFPRTLRAWLADRVPAHLVPSAIAVIAALPLTANGKVDPSALATPRPAATAHQEPASAAERTLAGLAAELLGMEGVGTEESFFALGGDSLLAMRLAAGAREAGLRLETRDVFERQTVRGMAARAEESSDAVLDELAALEGDPAGALLRALAVLEGGG